MSLTTQRQDNVIFSNNFQSFKVMNTADFVILILVMYEDIYRCIETDVKTLDILIEMQVSN